MKYSWMTGFTKQKNSSGDISFSTWLIVLQIAILSFCDGKYAQGIMIFSPSSICCRVTSPTYSKLWITPSVFNTTLSSVSLANRSIIRIPISLKSCLSILRQINSNVLSVCNLIDVFVLLVFIMQCLKNSFPKYVGAMTLSYPIYWRNAIVIAASDENSPESVSTS